MAEFVPSGIERLLQHDRRIVIAGLLLVSLAAWAWMLAGAGMGMSGVEMTRHSIMGMDMMAAAEWALPYAVLMFFMWWVMMIAMMLPSASPVILLAAAINRHSNPGEQPFGSTAAFTLGYLLIWAGFSAIAVLAQWLLTESALINGMMQSRNWLFSGLILITAGAWQFTPWKYACMLQCRNPVDYLTRYRRDGNLGALTMGLHHGLFCLGCCWFLMALLFVGGVMNLAWVAGLALYVWVEKVVPGGEVVARTMGAILVLSGAGLLVRGF